MITRDNICCATVRVSGSHSLQRCFSPPMAIDHHLQFTSISFHHTSLQRRTCLYHPRWRGRSCLPSKTIAASKSKLRQNNGPARVSLLGLLRPSSLLPPYLSPKYNMTNTFTHRRPTAQWRMHLVRPYATSLQRRGGLCFCYWGEEAYALMIEDEVFSWLGRRLGGPCSRP